MNPKEKHECIMKKADELALTEYGEAFDYLARDIQLIVFNAARTIINDKEDK